MQIAIGVYGIICTFFALLFGTPGAILPLPIYLVITIPGSLAAFCIIQGVVLQRNEPFYGLRIIIGTYIFISLACLVWCIIIPGLT
jgi:hypothetical protein